MALKTALQKVETTAAPIVTNPSESGVVFKISSLFISNISPSNDASVDIEVQRGASAYSILKGGKIPAGKTLSAFASKEIGVYLEEGDSLRLKSSSADSLEAVCSYSEIDPTAACDPLCVE